ncbi:hypothetical protein MUP95_04505 [bacterium]|nr:hypothetical protein [bacterium]
MNKKPICRRTFMKNTTGYLFLSAIVVTPGLISLKNYINRKNDYAHTQTNPCRQCPWLSECDLPAATLFKETEASIQLNQPNE